MLDEPAFPALAEHVAALGAALGDHGSGGPQTRDVLAVAVSAVGGAEFGGLTLVLDGQRPRSLAVTDDVVVAVDDLQYALRQGPCWDAATNDGIVRADDLAASREWPQFGPRCVAETGIVSMLSVRLDLSGDDTAAMNFYARRAQAFSPRDDAVAAGLAPFTTLALQSEVNADRAGHLRRALLSSRQIGTAVGILMSRELLTSEQAFQRLAEASQHLNQKVRDVAERVVLTGEVPSAPSARRTLSDGRPS